MSNTDNSHWIRSVAGHIPKWPFIQGKHQRFGVAVVGAGMVGLSAAVRLAEKGIKVVVVDSGKVGRGVTGNSTAKASSLHRLCYTSLTKSFGSSNAKLYAEYNEAGIEFIEENVQKHNLSCDFKRVPNYTFTLQENYIASIKHEVENARKAGLNVNYYKDTDDIGLPIKHLAAIGIDNQAEFNPYSYCIGLADIICKHDGHVYEDTKIVQYDYNNHTKPLTLVTEQGAIIEADKVILATGLPISDRSGHFGFVKPVTSYCMSFTLPENFKPPKAMYITAENEPYSLSIRSAPTRSLINKKILEDIPLSDTIYKSIKNTNKDALIICSAGHDVGEPPFGDEPAYDKIYSIVKNHFPVENVLYRWSGVDYETADKIPYVGFLNRVNPNVYTATGFAKWGLAAGSSAGLSIADMIINDKEFPYSWSKLMDSRRWDLVESLPKMAQFLMHVGKHFLGDRVKDIAVERIESLENNKGGVRRLNDGTLVGGFRDTGGKLHAVSLNCTHLGCHTRWNPADKTWDCPCHGSRFDVEGKVLHGPAVAPLKQYEVKEEKATREVFETKEVEEPKKTSATA